MATIGRPPSFEWTPELNKEIISRIMAGEAIADILESLGISRTSFYRRKVEDSEFGASIAHAQEEAQEAFVDSIESLIPTITEANYNAVKTQMWARMWIAGKRKAKKYGERIAQDVNVSGAIQILSTIPRPAQLEDGKTIDAEIIEE